MINLVADFILSVSNFRCYFNFF